MMVAYDLMATYARARSSQSGTVGSILYEPALVRVLLAARQVVVVHGCDSGR